MKGKVEEAKQMLCYAAGVNKKIIPLSLLDKVRGLGPGAGPGLGCGGASSSWDLCPEAVPSPPLEENGDSKIEACQRKARDQADTGRGRGGC